MSRMSPHLVTERLVLRRWQPADRVPFAELPQGLERLATRAIAGKAVKDGDIISDRDPEGIARLLVSMYLGLRQTSNLAEPERFLRDLENMWALMLPGFVKPDRIDYLNQFIKRRTAVALKKATPL